MGDIEARMIEDVEHVEAELKLHPLQRSGRRLRCSQAPLPVRGKNVEGGGTTAPRKNRLAWISDQQEVRHASEGAPTRRSQVQRKNSRRSGLVPVDVPTEIARCGFVDGRSDGGEVGSDVMFEAALANEAQQLLQLRDADDARAAEGF